MKAPSPAPRASSRASSLARSRAIKQTRLLAAFAALSLLLAASAPAWNYVGAAAGRGGATRPHAGRATRTQDGGGDAQSGAEPGGVRLPRLRLSAERERADGAGGVEAREVQSLRLGGARPLALASADFDEDGVPDLVTGYARGAGGALTLRRGNPDALFPNDPAAQERKLSKTFSAAPFFAASSYADSPARPDLVGAGDFDGDSHFDVVAAERGGDALRLFAGDGAGNFAAPREVRLPGRVTALAAGEMNQADGLADVVVAVEGEGGARLLVYEGPAGALNSEPESVALPEAAVSLALGQLDASSAYDLAAAAGPHLVVVHGRNRKLTREAAERAAVAPARVESLRPAQAASRSVAVGDFEVGREDEIALLADDGAVRLLSPPSEGDGGKAADARAAYAGRDEAPDVAAWRRAEVPGAWPQAASLVGAKFSAYQGDDLVLLDAAGRSLQLLAGDKLKAGSAAPADASSAASPTSDAPADGTAAAKEGGARASLAAGGSPVAALPMLLDTDALHDLVFVTAEEFDPVTALTTRPARVRLNGTRRGAADRDEKGPRSSLQGSASASLASGGQLPREGLEAAARPKQKDGAGRAAITPPSPSACTTPPNLAPNSTVNGALTPDDCALPTGEFYDEYTFDGQANQRVAITLTSAAFDTYLFLLRPSPDDTILEVNDDDGSGGTNSRIPEAGLDFITLPVSGRYTIAVTSFSAAETGAYQLSLAVGGASVCDPAPLAFTNGAASAFGDLLDTDCRNNFNYNANGAFGDWYSFPGVAGQRVRLQMFSPDFDPVIQLHYVRPDGNLEFVGRGDDNHGSREALLPQGGGFLTLPATATYRVLATSFSARSTGGYSLGVFFNTAACSITALPYNHFHNASLATTDCSYSPGGVGPFYFDVYQFVGRRNDSINVQMSSTAFAPFLELYRGQEPNPVAVGGNGGSTAYIPDSVNYLTLTASNIYTIRATSYLTSSVGPFKVTLFVQARSTVVTTPTDNGDDESPTAGSLRQAILRANANPGADNITFNIPGTGVRTITPPTPLPPVLGPTTIDGTSQPGYAGTPVVELNGVNAGPDGIGLKLLGGSSRVRGLAINRWGIAGIAVSEGGNNIIDGNRIGADPTGQFPRPYPAPTPGDQRESHGIIIDSSRDNRVGGTTAAERNVISGNRNVGVVMERSLWLYPTSGNRVQGNYIGTNAAGTAALGNGNNGVTFLTGLNNHIGGTAAGAGNVISGNGGPGVGLGSTFTTDGNLVQGNFIGTNAAGTAAVGNLGAGIIVGGILSRDYPHFASLVLTVNNRIGGTVIAARNVISGNLRYFNDTEGDGVNIINTGSRDNFVEGNYIGTNAAGTAALGNGGSGVFITFAPGNTVGGAAAGAGNVISGNLTHGIAVGLPRENPLTGEIIGGQGIRIINNRIGTNAAGTGPLRNAGDGVIIAADATDNLIQGNTIAFNGRNGVFIPDLTEGSKGDPGLRNRIESNRIYANAALGIDLHNAGVTPNDVGTCPGGTHDCDDGANLRQNFPTLSAAPAAPAAPAHDGGADASATARARLTMNSRPNTVYSVEVSFAEGCANSQATTAEVPLPNGKLAMMTNAQGNAAADFTFTFPGAATAGFLLSKATDPVNNTSEYSPCMAVPTAPVTPGSLQFSAAAYTVGEGGGSATVTVNRTGGSTGAVSVNYATANGTAAAGSDYTATSNTLTFADGVTSRTFAVPVINDQAVEGSETVNLSLSAPGGGATLGPQSTAVLTITDNDVAPAVQFSAAAYSFSEAAPAASVVITRTGSTTAVASVDYRTADADTFTVGCADAAGAAGAAYARCDFATSVGTVTFAAGQTSATVRVPIIDDAHAEGNQTFQLRLSNPAGAALGTPNVATVTVTDNDAAGAPNPVAASHPFFVRQQYLDFLSREPDDGGFNAWLGVLNTCPNANTGPEVASGCDRIFVSGEGFFRSVEFSLKGAYVFRLYKAAFNRLPDYTEIVSDMSFVAGVTAEEVFARRAQLVTLITQRQEFTQQYGAMTNQQYVAALLGRYNLQQVNAPVPANPDGAAKMVLTGAELTSRLGAGTLTRAQVLRAVADSDEVNAREFDNAFVAMQYYGYLRRKPEPSGYEAWLRVLRSGDTRTMVNGFLNSAEYKLRFGQP